MNDQAPDIFTNVHKGLRKALSDACLALGRAGTDDERNRTAREHVRSALHFVAHHGENEDVLLVPMLESRAPSLARVMRRAHEDLHRKLAALRESAIHAPCTELYPEACAFTADYLAHMHEEELVLEPAIRAVLDRDELTSFGRRSIERTTPADQRMMLGYMLPAMTRADAEQFLERLPTVLAEELRASIQ